jgi:hypothetical protein
MSPDLGGWSKPTSSPPALEGGTTRSLSHNAYRKKAHSDAPRLQEILATSHA